MKLQQIAGLNVLYQYETISKIFSGGFLLNKFRDQGVHYFYCKFTVAKKSYEV
jgi:hypothetical protein